MALLCIGLYELEHLSTPAHAVVSETVNATRALKKPWAKGVVNGVLRAYQRQEAVAGEALSRPVVASVRGTSVHAQLSTHLVLRYRLVHSLGYQVRRIDK